MSVATAIQTEYGYIDLNVKHFSRLLGKTEDDEGNPLPDMDSLYSQMLAMKPTVDSDNALLTARMMNILTNTWPSM